ncbi:hypothetical protein M426DRAFT_179409 [Hypoxylon sp. CI-4A]|nr:hypothetical protein M426DRAFT_179409 [Hypoxylon sp. CI-4A]
MSSPTPSQQQKQPLKKKSILKKPSTAATTTTTTTAKATTPPNPPTSPPKPPTASEARELAIQQARLIHQQWEFQDQIQDSIIELSRFPLTATTTSESHDASNPSPSDAAAFRRQVRAFQPGDYEDLIEERNTKSKCGYVLCPRPRARVPGGGAYKLLGYGTRDFSIVAREEVERWCSRECARRAMYVKVQLNETAAAERVGIPSIRIELLDEPREEREGEADEARKRVARELEKLEVEKQRKAARDAEELALERGDKKETATTTTATTTLPVGAGQQVTVTIREKPVTMKAREPQLDEDEEGEDHLVLDGYKTKFTGDSQTTKKGEVASED